MVTPNPQLRCRLCDDTLDAATAPMHLRRVHEVLPNECTIVDVPVVGEPGSPRAATKGPGFRDEERLAPALL